MGHESKSRFHPLHLHTVQHALCSGILQCNIMVAMVVMQHAIYRALDCFDLPTHWATVLSGCTSPYTCKHTLNMTVSLCPSAICTVISEVKRQRVCIFLFVYTVCE